MHYLGITLNTISPVTNVSPFCSSGVADGVGGWRDYGVDPSQFSATLMRTCERLVKEGRFTPSNPVGILTSGYYELLQNKVPLLGGFLPRSVHTVAQHSVHNDTPKNTRWSESCLPFECTDSGEKRKTHSCRMSQTVIRQKLWICTQCFVCAAIIV